MMCWSYAISYGLVAHIVRCAKNLMILSVLRPLIAGGHLGSQVDDIFKGPKAKSFGV